MNFKRMHLNTNIHNVVDLKIEMKPQIEADHVVCYIADVIFECGEENYTVTMFSSKVVYPQIIIDNNSNEQD